MSKDKHRRHDRLMAIIRNECFHGQIYLDREGRFPSNHPDIQRLVEMGFIRVVRRQAFSVFGPHIRRTVAIIIHSPWNEPK